MYYFLQADIIQVQRESKAKGAKVYVCVKDVTQNRTQMTVKERRFQVLSSSFCSTKLVLWSLTNAVQAEGPVVTKSLSSKAVNYE